MNHLAAIRKLLEAEHPVTWVFGGDSITHGSVHLVGERHYVQLFEQRVRTELGRRLDIIINTGVAGWNLRDHLLPGRERAIFCFQPAILSLCIGMNDAASVPLDEIPRWQEELEALLREVMERGTKGVILHIPPPIDPCSHHPMATQRRNLPYFCEALREAAGHCGAVLVDHQRFWEEREKSRDRATLMSLSDAIHPNAIGHRMMTECLCRVLEIWDSESPVGRLYQHR